MAQIVPDHIEMNQSQKYQETEHLKTEVKIYRTIF